MGRKCIVCGKGASYGKKGTTEARYCKEHGIANGCVLVRKSQKNPCIVQGCDTLPTYGKNGTRKMTYCKKHGQERGMVRLLFNECKVEKCRNRTKFGLPGGVKTHCEQHKEEGMVDCTHPTCRKCAEKPVMADPGDETKEVQYCKEHAPEGWIYPFNRSCQLCSKRASFGKVGQSEPIRCASCKDDGMVHIFNKYCEEPGCDLLASYGETPGKPKYCSRCGKKRGLGNVVKKTCKVEGCNIVPVFAPAGSKVGVVCKAHGEHLGYVDVRNRQCAYEEDGVRCLTQVNGKYTMCSFHDPNPRNRKTDEMRVVDWLRKHYSVQYSSWNKMLPETSCGKYMPDFLWILSTHIVILEVDENQHKSQQYNCDTKRMVEIFNSYGGMPIIFIRFNPSNFVCGNRRQNPAFCARTPILREALDQSINEHPQNSLVIHRLFYDSETSQKMTSSIAKWDTGVFIEQSMIDEKLQK